MARGLPVEYGTRSRGSPGEAQGPEERGRSIRTRLYREEQDLSYYRSSIRRRV